MRLFFVKLFDSEFVVKANLNFYYNPHFRTKVGFHVELLPAIPATLPRTSKRIQK